MSEVSAEAILEIFESNNGSKTERLNQIAELCQAAIDAGPSPEPTNVGSTEEDEDEDDDEDEE